MPKKIILDSLEDILKKVNSIGSIEETATYYGVTKQGLYQRFKTNGWNLMQKKSWIMKPRPKKNEDK
jgi:hypothetical protein